MTPLSWTYMLTVWFIIIVANIFCFRAILKNSGRRGKEDSSGEDTDPSGRRPV